MPVQDITSATVTFEDGRIEELTETQLATYGISLVQDDAAEPAIVVYSVDTTIGNAVFSIKLQSSVLEEPAWADFTLVTINYLFTEVVYEPWVPPNKADLDPRFDPGSTSTTTLSMM